MKNNKQLLPIPGTLDVSDDIVDLMRFVEPELSEEFMEEILDLVAKAHFAGSLQGYRLSKFKLSDQKKLAEILKKELVKSIKHDY